MKKLILLFLAMTILCTVCIACIVINVGLKDQNRMLVMLGCVSGALFIPTVQAFNKAMGDAANW